MQQHWDLTRLHYSTETLAITLRPYIAVPWKLVSVRLQQLLRLVSVVLQQL